jgi:ATP-dependent RNA helicase HelY
LERRADQRTSTIARTFDRVCAVLTDLGYLADDDVTDDGRRLTRLYNELDLLAAECLRTGVWEGLTPAGLAACASALVFEARKPDDDGAPRLPAGQVSQVLAAMVTTWARLEEVETRHGVDFLREPDLGFAWAAHQWASGRRLETVLEETDLTPGDFVRWMKQLIDVLGQIATAAGDESAVRTTARSAMDQLRRGVVDYAVSL